MSDSTPAFSRKPMTDARKGLILTSTGSGILLVLWIPVFADVPGDAWISTIGLLIFLVGMVYIIKAAGRPTRKDVE